MTWQALLETGAFYGMAVVSIAITMVIFELVTPYNNWQQIKAGNLSVAMATGGKIFGVANVMRFSIERNDSLTQAFIWSGIGFALLLLAYFVFEFLTPGFKADQEIERDNRAVGFLAMLISVATSYVIGASIN